MAMSIRTNVASLNAQRALFNAGNDLSKSMQRLSTGFRINSSADDAAGMAISTKLQSQISGINQASMNAQDGISMIQTAEGALDEVTNSLQRMRDLSVQAANSTLSNADRGAINAEIQALFANINNISSRTEFNGQKLLTGALSTAQDTTLSTLVAGGAVGAANVATIDVSKAGAGTIYTLSADTNIAGNMVLSNNADTNTQSIAVADIVATGSETLDFSQFGVKISLVSAAGETSANIIGALDTLAVQTSAGSSAAAFQVGANANQTESASFFNTQINALNASGAGEYVTLNNAISAFGALNGQTIPNAQTMIGAVDGVIAALVTSRASLGASQNSLGHTMNNLKTTSDNLSASNSRIRDVDVAAESSAMTRAQIISQSAVSVLAQANQMPQLALKLLG